MSIYSHQSMTNHHSTGFLTQLSDAFRVWRDRRRQRPWLGPLGGAEVQRGLVIGRPGHTRGDPGAVGAGLVFSPCAENGAELAVGGGFEFGEVAVLHTPCCGRPAMSQGLLAMPRRWALQNLSILGPMIEDGYDVVCIEPSCLSALRDDYARLLERTPAAADPRLALLQAHSYDFSEYVSAGVRDGSLALHLAPLDGAFVVHGHCHQKALSSLAPTVRMLELPAGHSVQVIPSGCCGMAGSFGYEREHFELSRQIGELVLMPAVRSAPADTVIAAPGTSCRHQIKDATGRIALHPIEILHAALIGPGRG